MKEFAFNVEALPSKRLYLSIISDYDINRSICELIDNAIDNWFKNNKSSEFKIDIELNEEQQTIILKDNSGGVKKSDLRVLVGPGQTTNDPGDVAIGIFGVGTKRAVVALAQDIKIRTRYAEEQTYQLEYDDEWFEGEEWETPAYKVSDIENGCTIIQLQRLRYVINERVIKDLMQHLAKTYAYYIAKDNLSIKVNNESIEPRLFENWAYPPEHRPRKYESNLTLQNGKEVKVKIIAGLSKESSPATGEYGVYFYCNKRLISQALKNFDVGFVKGLAGLPHPSVSLVRVFVHLDGEAQLMPWNSSKSGINYNHEVFKTLRDPLVQILKHYTSLSRALEGQWHERVFNYSTGSVIDDNSLIFETGRNLNFPPVPRSKLRYYDLLKDINKDVVRRKPWAQGLYESLGLLDLISKNKKFEFKNRYLLILLDSTLEIAFKEYLVNHSGTSYNDTRLLSLFSNRVNVHDEIKNYESLGQTMWGKINYYYRLRCKLIHERVTVDITNDQIQDYRDVVEKVLKKLFGLKFT